MEDAVQTFLAVKGAVVGGWFLLWLGLEHWRPMGRVLARGKAAWRRWARNASLFGINALLSPLIVVPISAWAAAYGPGWRPDWFDGVWGLAVDLILLDLFIYWWHRANHELPFLWRFHQVHHYDTDMDTTTAVRFHFGEVILSACVRGAVILALDIPLLSVIVFEAVVLLSALFQHSNAKLPARLESLLSRVIITPSIHWVHHHAVRKDTDSNYGNTFSFWDRLFGTLSPTKRWAEMPIGLEDEPKDRSLTGLLTIPFRS